MRYIHLSCLVLFLACSPRSISSSEQEIPVKGSYSIYTSAMGSGRGILFQIPLEEKWVNAYAPESFFLHGKSYPFVLKKENAGYSLEAALHVAFPAQSGEGSSGVPVISAESKFILDSLIVAKQFYPSWILLKGKNGNATKLVIQEYLSEKSLSKPN
jgi:hypothetical protein